MCLNPIDPTLKQLAEKIAVVVIEELQARLRKGDMLVGAEYLSPRQVSELTSTPIKTLEAMRGSRKGPPYYKVGGRVRYRLQDVRDFIEEGGPVK